MAALRTTIISIVIRGAAVFGCGPRMDENEHESANTDAGGGRMVLTFAVRSASINKDYPLMTKSRSIFLLALGGLLFLAPAVRSQSLRGSIAGRVLDASNLPLAN